MTSRTLSLSRPSSENSASTSRRSSSRSCLCVRSATNATRSRSSGDAAAAAKATSVRAKTTLSPRGWVGMFLGRSPNALGTYEVWVPEISRKVRSSSVAVDEEFLSPSTYITFHYLSLPFTTFNYLQVVEQD